MENQIININYNGIKFLAVIIKVYSSAREDFYDDVDGTHGVQTVDTMLIYAQKRLAEVTRVHCKYDGEGIETIRDYVVTLADYCQIPDYDSLLDSHEDAIRQLIAMRYSRDEAINILDGRNADSSKKKPLSF